MHKRTYRNLLKISTLILIVSVTLNIGFVRKLLSAKEEAQYKAQEEVNEMERGFEKRQAKLKQEISASYNKAIKEAFTREELAQAMQRQWQYIMSVNGDEIKSSNQYIKAGNVRIMVAEVLKGESPLSQEILQLGCLDESIGNMNLEDLIEVYSTVPYTLKREEAEEGIKYYYEFTEVPKETFIILKLSPLITEKLAYKAQIKEDQITLITKA